VLVVDDNATNCRVLTGILRMWGARPTAVDGGRPAVDELRRAAAAGEPYPLLLTDAMMPEMDGFMLVEELRKEPGLAPHTIMMLTSADRQADAQRCRRLGMSAYLVKPVKADELQIAILAALSGATRESRPASSTQELSNITGGATPARPARILLAEDNPVNQRVALHILQKGGHSVLAVSNGREAVEALKREEFELVLMDVQMPEMDGFEATDAIRTRERITGRHIPIIAMTAHAMKGDRERCLEAGMDDYVAKPVHAAELLRVIQKFALATAAPVAAAPPTDNHEVPVFDRHSALDRVSDEEELLNEVIQLFLDDAPNRMSEIRASLEEGDPKRLEISAHSLKGAAGYVGAERMARQAHKLEELGRSVNLSRALDEFPQLERELDQFTLAVAAFTPVSQAN
jgi:CheY-like chemotaxis protein/HPt (histidine-containing phosphotransfer) domain-containing protein